MLDDTITDTNRRKVAAEKTIKSVISFFNIIKFLIYKNIINIYITVINLESINPLVIMDAIQRQIDAKYYFSLIGAFVASGIINQNVSTIKTYFIDITLVLYYSNAVTVYTKINRPKFHLILPRRHPYYQEIPSFSCTSL